MADASTVAPTDEESDNDTNASIASDRVVFSSDEADWGEWRVPPSRVRIARALGELPYVGAVQSIRHVLQRGGRIVEAFQDNREVERKTIGERKEEMEELS